MLAGLSKSCVLNLTIHFKEVVMKPVFVLVSMLFASSFASAQITPLEQQQPQHHSGWLLMPPVEGGSVFDLFFLDQQVGWYIASRLVTQDSVATSLYKTLDGATSWHRVADAPSGTAKIHFLTEMHGYALLSTSAGAIYRTLDGGMTWHSVASAISGPEAFAFRNNVGLVVGFSSHAGRTDDLMNWEGSGQFPNSAWDLQSITFITDSHVVAVGNVHEWPKILNELPTTVVVTSTDAGQTWIRQKMTNHERNFSNVVAIDSLTVIALASAYLPSRSTNRGGHWTPAQIPDTLTTGGFRDMVFPDPLHGTIVGLAGKVMRSKDSGKTWAMQHSGTIKHLQSVHMFDSLIGFIMGQDGVYLRTTNGGYASASAEILTESTLKLYPDPCTSQTTVQVSGLRRPTVTLRVFDARGMEALLPRRLDVALDGVNNISLEVTSLQSGSYTCTVDDGVKVRTGNFTIIR